MLPHPLTEPRHLQHILCRVGRLRGMREEDHIFLAMLKDAANYGKNSLKVRKKRGGEGRGAKLTWLQWGHKLTTASTLS